MAWINPLENVSSKRRSTAPITIAPHRARNRGPELETVAINLTLSEQIVNSLGWRPGDGIELLVDHGARMVRLQKGEEGARKLHYANPADRKARKPWARSRARFPMAQGVPCVAVTTEVMEYSLTGGGLQFNLPANVFFHGFAVTREPQQLSALAGGH